MPILTAPGSNGRDRHRDPVVTSLAGHGHTDDFARAVRAARGRAHLAALEPGIHEAEQIDEHRDVELRA